MKNKFQLDQRPVDIHEIRSFKEFLAKALFLKNCTIRNIDFTSVSIVWDNIQIDHSTFIGCTFQANDAYKLIRKGAIILSEPPKVPYQVYRNKLYSYAELNAKSNDVTLDERIYKHFCKYRDRRNINESLWQKSHDHAIDEALRDLIEAKSSENKKKLVGFMGGHGVKRDSTEFWKCAELAWRVTNAGYFVVTGGGPGIMEAANMGAYFSSYSLEKLEEAIQYIQKAPSYRDKDYEKLAQNIVKQFPDGQESLAIPTWFYGHEPSNAFAPHIAKYFSNANREETLLAISLHGIIYCPGSAGTIQEIFADAAQNHYTTYEYVSPMIFFNKKYFTKKLPVMPLLKELSDDRAYEKSIHISDDQMDILQFLQKNPPFKPKHR